MFALSCVLSGMTGTFLMTLVTTLGSKITGYYLHVPSILGTMVTMRIRSSGKPSDSLHSLTSGYILH